MMPEPPPPVKQEILLSILIPSVFERNCNDLVTRLLDQIGDKPIEVLVFKDNKKRSCGLKCQSLLDISKGRYVSYIDDDDDVSPDYIKEIYSAISLQSGKESPADVIVFSSQAQLLGYGYGENPFIVKCGIEYDNEQCDVVNGVRPNIHRKPWQWCVWLSSLAKTGKFSDSSVDPDWYWLQQIIPRVANQHRIDKTLHYYRYNKATSLSVGSPSC